MSTSSESTTAVSVPVLGGGDIAPLTPWLLFRLVIVNEGRPYGPSVLLSKSRLVLLDICVLRRGMPSPPCLIIVVLCRGGALIGSCVFAIVGIDCALSDFSIFCAPSDIVLRGGRSAICTEGRDGRWDVDASIPCCESFVVDSCSGPSLRWSKSWSFGSSSILSRSFKVRVVVARWRIEGLKCWSKDSRLLADQPGKEQYAQLVFKLPILGRQYHPEPKRENVEAKVRPECKERKRNAGRELAVVVWIKKASPNVLARICEREMSGRGVARKPFVQERPRTLRVDDRRLHQRHPPPLPLLSLTAGSSRLLRVYPPPWPDAGV